MQPMLEVAKDYAPVKTGKLKAAINLDGRFR
jgi:hypothetical protein